MWLLKNLLREILTFDSWLNLISYFVVFVVGLLGFTLLLVRVVDSEAWTPWLPIFAAIPAFLVASLYMYICSELDY